MWYLIISFILFLVWLVVLVGGLIYIWDEAYDREEAIEGLRVLSAALAGGLILVVFHVFILALAVPVIFFWGCWNGVKILRQKPWQDA